MKRLLSSLLLSVLIILNSNATELTIDECVNLARENYPAVAQYGLLDKVKQLNLSNVSKMWLPQGSMSAQVTWQNDVAALPELLTNMLSQQGVDYPGLDKTQYRIGLDVAQQIWDGGKTKANKEAIVTGNAVEQTAIDLQLYDVEGRVEEIYFTMLLLNERISQCDKTITLVESTLSQVRSMYANGVAMKSDCDQIEAKYLALHQQKSKLTATLGSIRRIMEIFIGESIGERTLVLPSEDLTDNGDGLHPQLRLFDDRISNLAAQESGIKASVMPTINAFASGYYGYPGYNMFKNMQSRDLSFNFMIGVKIAWNFGSLYTRSNSLNKLQLQRNQIESERATFNFNNNIAISESVGLIASLRDVMRDDERIVELRNSVITAARSQLDNGIIDATALLSKITDSELAENDMAQHHIELVKAIYNLNHLRNK
ncbi:TolC family protein [uncultured Muribaculum sp.]|uniref:TolC family protein n=1 Tax=uncultured Muribaculum sp. TaxID=1918613 RepID=UPI00272FEDD5|nr:TolC family protein [uncultured Muribaculum sp.]